MHQDYDVAIIGGGLAGLALAIQLARGKSKVVVIEKEKYPFHKVCGEYISNESRNFLMQLGVPLSDLQVADINTLKLTAPNGRSFSTQLPLGGFGISRYTLDACLASLAKAAGVFLMEETRVEAVSQVEDKHRLVALSKNESDKKVIEASVCCAAYGKRSNLDVKWKRPFILHPQSRLNNYVGVKYHIKTYWPDHVIGLHNFEDGYCGISQIEEDRFCLCYLTTAKNLKQSNSSIQQMQEQVLYRNPHLKYIFSNSDFLYEAPLTISQISFSRKALIEHGIFMVGDAAGMIAPLCGNGMSMALHASKILNELILGYLQNRMTKTELEQLYKQKWHQAFEGRLRMGRVLQNFFGASFLSNLFVSGFQVFPFLAKTVIQKTHGTPF